ncbi:2-oxoglutarate and iron-dependent oxygenase domain-containing protein [Streptomyces angustmyceticus]|uniref:2OG-Fe(II) oxygenase n=1 Tax=Streptomyces angustmyceticus TaxID=285578 RepID=A0A5J4LPY4_9ACTN|nr:2-oxoglutarate and iron-dependent oxygenase domain-containing protein [Streptomyces angustmyceticus]GES33549.1 2OG-Fe(II) oxygenase [Streptomyces angustmyceticus]
MTTLIDHPMPQHGPRSPITVVDGYVPVIDLASALGGDAADRRAVADAIGETCETSGFLVVVGHGVPAETLTRMYDATREFFALPQEQKEALRSDARDPLMRGFGRKGSLAASNADATVEEERARPDLSETFTYNRLGDPGDTSLPPTAGAGLRLPNKWPALPGFEDAYRAYYARMEDLAVEIMRLFALALRLPEDWFDAKVDRHMTNLTANYYPAQPVAPDPGQLRKGVHSDWGSLTLLYQDDAPGGLQVRDKNGDWLDVPVIPGSFVVNIGDLMAIWTNDTWVSTVHRVVNPPREFSHRERFSMPFFHQPNFDTLIECIPTCTGPDTPPKYAPVLSGEYIMDKFRRAYDL